MGINSHLCLKKKIPGKNNERERKTENLPQNDAQDKVAFRFCRKWIFPHYVQKAARENGLFLKRVVLS